MADATYARWTAANLPLELVAILDTQCGKTHSPTGVVRRCLANILNAYDQMRDTLDGPDPEDEYGGDLTPPLCCCRRGLMCASCGTGHHWDCPDRDDPDDDRDWDDGENDDNKSEAG